jgi:predicted  nucleic acid-binding Zn-ribbon protein
LQQLQEDIMTANSANPEADSHMDDLAAKTIDLQHRLADGARKLEALSSQQANSTSLKPIAQLAIYALALTRRVAGPRLFDIKCTWFNEHEYCEFFPRTLFARE